MTQKIRQNALAESQEMAKNIKYVRREILRLTQKDFAEIIHMSQSFISDLEKEKKFPHGDFFVFLSKYLEIDFYYLLTGEGNIFLTPKELDLKKVSDRVKKVRLANSKTEIDFANVLSIEVTKLVRIEREIINPEYKDLVMIHHFFRVDLKWLETGEGIEPAKPLKTLEEKSYYEAMLESQGEELNRLREELNKKKEKIEFLQEMDGGNKTIIERQSMLISQQQELLQMKLLSNELGVKEQVKTLAEIEDCDYESEEGERREEKREETNA